MTQHKADYATFTFSILFDLKHARIGDDWIHIDPGYFFEINHFDEQALSDWNPCGTPLLVNAAA